VSSARGLHRRADAGAFVEAMVSWLNERVAPPGVTIGADTPLFENGLIDSMRILELIAWTERETGLTIADEQVRMDNFRTPRRIAEVFVVG
jgi:acyl carrier protein